jgi:hypothetical protein
MIFRFRLTDDREVELPYDFDEHYNRTVAVLQYYELNKEDVVDFELVQGWPKEEPKQLAGLSAGEILYNRDRLINVLHAHNYIGKDAAQELGLSPRLLIYWIKRTNLEDWLKKKRAESDERRQRVQARRTDGKKRAQKIR